MNKEAFKEQVQKGVDSMARVRAEQDFRKMLGEDVKEGFDMAAVDFNARVKAAYDIYAAEEAAEKASDVIDEVKQLGFM